MNNKRDILLNILGFLFVALTLLGLYKILEYNKNVRETTDTILSVTELINEVERNDDILISELDTSLPENLTLSDEGSARLIEILKESYPDTIGHIGITNTNISYPIVQTDNNDYYLTHSPNKEKNANGSIFMSSLNSPEFTDDNTVIYGHNIKSGLLFQNLHFLKEQEFYDENNIINIQTPMGAKDYLIFAVYQTEPDYQYKTPNYPTEKEKLDYMYEFINKSLITPNENVRFLLEDENSKMITLSTCETGGEKRLVIHGVEIKEMR